jgi:hypothetical protein
MAGPSPQQPPAPAAQAQAKAKRSWSSAATTVKTVHGTANSNTFGMGRVKHWHMILMVFGCAISGYIGGQMVYIDPETVGPGATVDGVKRKVTKETLV